MSGQATGWVLRHGPGRKDRAAHAVLVTIADAANADGDHAHPGIPAMVNGSGYSRATVFDALRRLVSERYVEVEEEGGGRGKATVYRLPGVLDPAWKPHVETVQSSDPSSGANGPETVQPGGLNGPETVQSAGSAPHIATSTVSNGSAPSASTKGSRLPEPFVLNPEMKAWAAEHTPAVDVRDQTQRFADYWRGISGSRAVKADWLATWRNWMRRANDDLGQRPRARKATLEQIGEMHFDEKGRLVDD